MQLGKRWKGVCAGLALCLCAPAPGHDAVRLSYAPYTKVSARRVEMMRLTREGKYDAVEAFLTPLQRAYERKEVDELAVGTAFGAFSTSDETLGPALDRWVEQAPKSSNARLARARYLRNRFFRFRNVERPHSPAAIGAERVREIGSRAIADYRAALGMNPRLMVAHSDLVELARVMGDNTVSRENFQQSFEVAPATWVVRHELDRVGAVPRQQQAAFLADAARHEKENPLLLQLPAQLQVDRAHGLWNNGQLAQALAIYDTLLETLDVFEYHKDRAQLYGQMKRVPEAYAEIDHAVALMPGKPDGYRHRAWLHMRSQRWADAIADFRRGLEIDPLEPELNLGLGESLEKTGDIEAAVKALELSARWSVSAYAYQRIGWLSLNKLGKPKESLAALDLAVAIDPKDKWTWFKRGEALEALHDPRAADSFAGYLALADESSAEDRRYIANARQRIAAAKQGPRPPAAPAR